jgi:hypothetical protein
VVDATAIAPPHHFSLTNLGFQTLAGPQDVQRVRPLSGIAVCESISERKTAGDQADDAGLLKAHRFIFESRQRTTEIMAKWFDQPMESAAGSYDLLVLSLSRNGEISDEEWETLNIKPRSVDAVRDFSSLRQAQKELGTK